MTNVIAFRMPSPKGAPRAKLEGTAEILFFTGVRYVRDEPVSATPDTPRHLSAVTHATAVVAEERLQA